MSHPRDMDSILACHSIVSWTSQGFLRKTWFETGSYFWLPLDIKMVWYFVTNEDRSGITFQYV